MSKNEYVFNNKKILKSYKKERIKKEAYLYKEQKFKDKLIRKYIKLIKRSIKDFNYAIIFEDNYKNLETHYVILLKLSKMYPFLEFEYADCEESYEVKYSWKVK